MPITVQLRDQTEAAAKAAIEAGDLLTAGKKLTKLVQIYKWVQPSDGRNFWIGAADAGLKAIEYLRQCDDPIALAEALRATAGLRFVSGVDHPALLEESYTISQREGDQRGIAWCLWQQSHLDRKDQRAKQLEALRIFESIDDIVGQAVLNQTLGISATGSERTGYFIRAGDLFARAGELQDAGRAYLMAITLSDKMGRQSQRQLAHRAIALFRKTANRSSLRLAYRRLRKLNAPLPGRTRRPSL